MSTEPEITPPDIAGAGALVPIASIKVGERIRKDMGDIAGLAASIADIGLLHPIVVKPDGTLIAGERRLAACKKLGWDKVPVTVKEERL
jgi:ParB family transcriptional regulator, chromosome partitioning protein